jgi:membrane-bound lytic murein transglycosylase F
MLNDVSLTSFFRIGYGLMKWLKIFLAVLIALCVWSALYGISWYLDDSVRRIEKAGVLTAIMENNANVYYSYRDKYMGFEYDLAKGFAESLGVELRVITPGWDAMADTLNGKEGDMIAAGMTITGPRKFRMDFSEGYMEVQQQVIVHKSNHEIRKLSDLRCKTIHVRSGTSYEQRLRELKNQGMDFEIVSILNVSTEELIRKVAEKEIEITLADSNIAQLNQRYYPDIRIAFPIEKTQFLGWAVRKGENKLRKKINRYFQAIHKNGTFQRIYEKYYRNVQVFDYVDLKKFHKRLETRLPRYRDMIREQAEKHGFDWRMIAAVVYQESHFNPRAKSHTGVRGLMQVTLETAREMGITNRMAPAESIQAGVGYIAKLFSRFDDIENPSDRFLFTLASYNVGFGHVRDAQQICREKGWDPERWSSLAMALPLLREEAYYKNTSYGYARGTEPVRYVNRILTYYDIIKRKSLEETAPADPSIPTDSKEGTVTAAN